MEPGKLDKRITIMRMDSVPDNIGGMNTTWIDLTTVWAEQLRPRFVRAEIQGAPATEVTQGFRIRAGIDVIIGDKVRLEESLFIVLHVDASKNYEFILTTREVER